MHLKAFAECVRVGSCRGWQGSPSDRMALQGMCPQEHDLRWWFSSLLMLMLKGSFTNCLTDI